MIRWMENKAFAFTIMDDTDRAQLRTIKPFYDALIDYGFRTTKTVWGLDSADDDPHRAVSLQDAEYRAWALELQRAGFEIAWHGARSGGTEEEAHRSAIDDFREIFGSNPRTYANHAVNPECIYWGEERFDDKFLRTLFRRFSGRSPFWGSKPGSPYHWERLCAERLHYVRGFTYDDTVTSRQDPWMPYRDERRPAVARWFSASDGSSVEPFVRLLTPERIDALERSRGCCIVYAHVADGFVRNGRVDPRVLKILENLASRNGWYVPVQTVLDHIEAERGIHTIATSEHRRLEWRFAAYQVRRQIGDTLRKVRNARRPAGSEPGRDRECSSSVRVTVSLTEHAPGGKLVAPP